MMLLLVLVLSSFLGIELIRRIPSQLHTPLMSGSNAISGVTIVGAIIATSIEGEWAKWLAGVALLAATINVVGGYVVTDRMLRMFGGAAKPRKPGGGAS